MFKITAEEKRWILRRRISAAKKEVNFVFKPRSEDILVIVKNSAGGTVLGLGWPGPHKEIIQYLKQIAKKVNLKVDITQDKETKGIIITSKISENSRAIISELKKEISKKGLKLNLD